MCVDGGVGVGGDGTDGDLSTGMGLALGDGERVELWTWSRWWAKGIPFGSGRARFSCDVGLLVLVVPVVLVDVRG